MDSNNQSLLSWTTPLSLTLSTTAISSETSLNSFVCQISQKLEIPWNKTTTLMIKIQYKTCNWLAVEGWNHVKGRKLSAKNYLHTKNPPKIWLYPQILPSIWLSWKKPPTTDWTGFHGHWKVTPVAAPESQLFWANPYFPTIPLCQRESGSNGNLRNHLANKASFLF